MNQDQYQQQPPYQQPDEQQPPYQQQAYYQPNYAQSQIPPKPDNYLVWAILATLFCCLPFGIVSIVYASKVDSLYSSQDYFGAKAASDNAKKWAWWSAISCIVIGIIAMIFAVIAGMADSM